MRYAVAQKKGESYPRPHYDWLIFVRRRNVASQYCVTKYLLLLARVTSYFEKYFGERNFLYFQEPLNFYKRFL